MEWLDEIIDRVNAGSSSGEWASKTPIAATSAVDKLELPAIPDDAVVDLVGCLIDEVVRLRAVINAKLHRRRCHDCGYVGWYVGSISPLVPCDQCRSQKTRRLREGM